jgi:hypothetical protein
MAGQDTAKHHDKMENGNILIWLEMSVLCNFWLQFESINGNPCPNYNRVFTLSHWHEWNHDRTYMYILLSIAILVWTVLTFQ